MTVALDTSLDVSSKYKELVERATDGNSVYVRAKEALEALWADGNIDSGVKAD